MLIYVRNPNLWRESSLDQLSLLSSPTSPDFEKRRQQITLWDRSFSISYFAYRWQLYKIARKSWEATNATILHQNQGKLQAKLQTADPNDWLLVTDDDDWFHPQVSEFLATCKEDFITWTCIMFKTERAVAQIHLRTKPRVGSNCFAFRIGVACQLKPEDLHLITMKQKPIFDVAKKLNWSTAHFPKQQLSCYNLHPGCAHLLLGKTPRIPASFAKVAPVIPGSLSWIRPYCEEFLQVTRAIEQI